LEVKESLGDKWAQMSSLAAPVKVWLMKRITMFTADLFCPFVGLELLKLSALASKKQKF